MRLPLAPSLRALLHPGTAFAQPAPTLGRALRGMALVWMPLALMNTGWTTWGVIRAYEGLRNGASNPGILMQLGLNFPDLHQQLAALPAPPAFGRVWPWLMLAVPLAVLGTWLHHAVWDHTCLWLLGGLKRHRGFGISLLAEAEALRITAVGTLLGFLGYLPVLGILVTFPLLLLDAYLWLFRGYALAARHGCEPWRGLAATVLHAVLLGCLALGLFGLLLVQLRLAV